MSKKRFLAILLSVVMLLQAMPTNVLAAETLISNEVGNDTYHAVEFYRAAVDESGNPVLADGVLTYALVTTQLVKSGSDAVLPDIPDVDGYQTIGWERVPAAEGNTISADGVQYYARYSKIGKYTVSVKYVYADGSEASQSLSYDINIAEMESMQDIAVTVPAQTGFAVSAVDEAGNTVDISSGSFVIDVSALTGNKSYTVTYAGKEVNYTVYHLVQQLDGNYVTKSETKTGIAGTQTNAQISSEYAVKGFEVVGFDPAVNQTNINPDNSTVIEIKYDRLTYSLSYNTDGGTYLDAEVLMYGAPVKIPAVSKLGYTFNGWNATITNDDGTTSSTAYSAEASFAMPAGDVVLTAMWEKASNASYTIVYWQQKLTDDKNASDSAKTYDYKESVIVENAEVDAKGSELNIPRATDRYGIYFTLN